MDESTPLCTVTHGVHLQPTTIPRLLPIGYPPTTKSLTLCWLLTSTAERTGKSTAEFKQF